MKKILSFLIFALIFSSAFGQGNQKLGHSPAVTNDWREGFVNITEINSGIGLGNIDVPYSKNYFGITTVNGYQFSRNIKAGIGIGVQIHNGGTLIPVYVDGRLSLDGQEIVPFFGLAGGVAASLENLNGQSRVFINPTAGIRYIVKPKLSITLSLGVMTQAGGAEARSSFLCFKLGAEFKGKSRMN